MKTPLLFIITCLLIFSCNSNKKIELPTIITAPCDTIVYYKVDKMQASSPSVYAINKNDNLYLDSLQRYDDTNFEDSFTMISKKQDSISIMVDTSSQDFHSLNLHFWSEIPIPPPTRIDSIYDKEFDYNEYIFDTIPNLEAQKTYDSIYKKLEETHYKGYPIFVYNESNSNKIIQKPLDYDLFIILEAKNKDGNWKPIEYWEQRTFSCGTGHQNYILKPHSFITSSVIRYQGDFKTQLRVKFYSFGKVYYSNTYTDYINYSQFDQKDVIDEIKSRFINRNKKEIQRRIELAFLNYNVTSTKD